jgi:hypothetical protein
VSDFGYETLYLFITTLFLLLRLDSLKQDDDIVLRSEILCRLQAECTTSQFFTDHLLSGLGKLYMCIKRIRILKWV